LIQGEPQTAIDALKSKVWRKSISKAALPEFQSRFNVLATRLVGGQPQINVFSEHQPDDGFVMVEPDLEDVYFLQLRASQKPSTQATA
jgi:hypothetical protein